MISFVRTKPHNSNWFVRVAVALTLVVPGVVSAQSLVGHWALDGNQSLNVTGQPLIIPNSRSLQSNQFTVAYQVRLDSATNYAAGASKGDAWQTSIVAGQDSEGRAVGGQSLRFCVGGVCGTSPALGLDPVGRWMQVSFTYDGKMATTYADGIAVSSFEASVLPGNSTADVLIGRSGGQVRDIRLYDAPVAVAVTTTVSSGAVLGATGVTVGSAAVSSSVVLSAGSAWTATSNASFLHLQTGSASGTGGALVLFSVDAFTGTGSRSGTLTIAGLTLTVHQYGTNYQSTAQDAFMGAFNFPGADPYTVAVDGAGSLYVADNGGTHSIFKLDTNGVRTQLPSNAVVTLYLGTYSNTYGNFSGVAVAGDGTVFYTINDHSYTYGTPGYLTAPYPNAGTLRSWDPINGDRATTVSGLSNPQGVAVDAAGNVYIADTGNHSIKKWNRTTGTVTTLISGSANNLFSGLVSPMGVAVDLSGNLYIADPGNNIIWMWTAATSQLTALIPFGTLTQPEAVAVDGYGNLFIVDTSRSQNAQEEAVKKWTAGTGQLTTLASGGLPPAGVAVDASGNVYVDYYSPGTNTSQIHKLSFGFQQVAPVPSVVSQTQAAASSAITAVGLTVGNVTLALSATIPVGSVISTNPTAGTILALGSTVDLVISMPRAFVPNVVSQTQSAAGAALTGAGLTTGAVTLALSATIPVGSVISTSPAAGTLVNLGSAVNLVVSMPHAYVPNVVSQTQAVATSTLTGVGLTVGTVTFSLSSTVPVGSVISTSPVAGTLVTAGSAVNLVVSSAGIATPNVVGQTQAAATTAITSANLVPGTVTPSVSTTVPAGTVISQNPVAGTVLANGSTVDLVISAGTITPDVIAQTQAAATAAITAAGLIVGGVTTAVSPTGLSNPGQVISDAVGNVYIADTGNNAIKKWVKVTGQLITLVSSGLNQPGGVGLDKAGNVYIADTGNNAIKKWDPLTNQVTTLVSTGLNRPQSIVVDRLVVPSATFATNREVLQSNGDVYIADTGNNAVKMWTAATQQVSTLVSSGLNQPAGIGLCVVNFGFELYIADTGNNAIKRWSGSQLVNVISAGLNRPTAVVCSSYTDSSYSVPDPTFAGVFDYYIPYPYGGLYVTDSGNNAIKYYPYIDEPLDHNTNFYTVASGLNAPVGVASDAQENAWFTTAGGNGLLKASTPCGAFVQGCTYSWTTSTLIRSVPAGTVVSSNPAAGTSVNVGSAVNLTIEAGAVGLSSGSVLVGNTATNSSVFLTVRPGALQAPWTATANDSFLHVSSGSGSGTASAPVAFSIDAFSGTGIRSGTLTIAGLTFTVTQTGSDYVATTQLGSTIAGAFHAPDGVVVDGFGNLYIADTTNNVVKKWTARTQQISTLIPSGLTAPSPLAMDGSGNLYIGDNVAVWLWSAAAQQLTQLIAAHANGIALDASGNVYVTDSLNERILKWTAATGQLTTLVASVGTPGTNTPRGLAVDSAGNVYFEDGQAGTIREWNAATQQVTTLVSTGLNGPWGIVVEPSGDFDFSDSRNSAIKKWSAATQSVTTLVQGSPAAATNRYRGVALDTSGNLYWSQTDGNVIGTLSKAYVSSGSLNEPNTAGTGALPPVIPITTSLTGTFVPVSDQTWLTVGAIANGVVNFSFAANVAGTPRTGHITMTGVAFTINQGVQVAVPDVTGQTQAAATTAITGVGLIVGTVSTATSSTAAVGNVISTSPTATTQVNFGSAVNLVISTGPAQVAVPNVVGQTQATAATAITGAGLVVGTVTTASSSTVAVGNVISTSPNAATQVNPGSAVNLVVSTGPAQVAVPNVIGQTQATATTAITGAGLIVGTVTTATSGTVTAGNVISTSPAAATQVNPGSAVNLVVSTGPAQVAVPNVIGQTQATATTAITGAGLVVGTITTATSSTVAAGSVISTSPTAATQVNPGSAVTLVISTGPALVPALDITSQITITRGAAIFSRVTGRYTQSITLSNSGAALPAAAFVLDSLATGYALYQPSGFTSAAPPASSPFQEIGVVGAGANVTFTLELTRTGTPALTYTPRILGPGAR